MAWEPVWAAGDGRGRPGTVVGDVAEVVYRLRSEMLPKVLRVPRIPRAPNVPRVPRSANKSAALFRNLNLDMAVFILF